MVTLTSWATGSTQNSRFRADTMSLNFKVKNMSLGLQEVNMNRKKLS